MNIRACLLAVAIVLSQTAFADKTTPDRNTLLNSQQTSATAQLLELQRSGKLASRTEQRLSGPAQSKVYERYINSFGTPIPNTYISNEFSE